MFKTIYGKIIIGIIVLAIGFGGGYYLMPTKTETITKTETVTVTDTKYVTVTDKKAVDKLGADITGLQAQIAALAAEKAAVQKQLTDLQAANNEAALKLKALRVIETKNWATTVETAIIAFNADITWYNNAIKAKEDAKVAPTKSIALLQASINAKQLLISALVADNPIGNLAAIRVLEDEIIALRAAIIPFEAILTGLNNDIASLGTSRAAVQAKVILDQKCVSEITRYINDGTAFSADVAARLHVLGLI